MSVYKLLAHISIPRVTKQGNKTPASQEKENKHISRKRLENVTFSATHFNLLDINFFI